MEQKILKILWDTWLIMSGGKPVSYYLSGLIIAAFMAFLAIYIRAKVTRNKASISTPGKWDNKFFIQDNFLRFCASIIVLYFVYRSWDINSMLAKIGVGAAIAASLDQIIVLLMNRSQIVFDLFTADRSKFVQTPPNDETPKAT